MTTITKSYHIRALFGSVEVGDYQCVDTLLKKGVPADVRDEKGKTPLMVASERGYDAIVRLLIVSGGDVNACDESGWTPLMCAACYGRHETAKFLVEEGADIAAKTIGV